MPRATKEWIGKTADSRVPPRVRQRVFDRYGGICYLSGRLILPGEPWDLEHVIALILGGENRESNLRPALKDKHKAKTKVDVAAKAKSNTVRQKHLGIKKRKGPPMPGSRDSKWKRKMDGTIERRRS